MTDKFNPNQDFPDNYSAYHALGVHLSQSANPDQRNHGLFIRDVVAHFVAWLGERKKTLEPRDLMLSSAQGMAGMAHILRLNYELKENEASPFLADLIVALLVYFHKNADEPFVEAMRTIAIVEQGLRNKRSAL